MATLANLRNTRPATADHLWHWVDKFTGVRIARNGVCRDHQPPFAWFARQWFERPANILILGSRGSGKSFLEAILTHLESRFNPRSGTRILGGSLDQSFQIYDALSKAIRDGRGSLGSDASTFAKLLKSDAVYRNGSEVKILAASPKSVRGPHVPTLRLDEVDEIDSDIRDSSLGMCMRVKGVDLSASISMASTWHRLGGPMSELMTRADHDEFPRYTTCTFDVIEFCPGVRSGRFVGGVACYENCPACPIVKWCHSERDRNGGIPLAKLSHGHYAIDSLIQKVKAVSSRVFEADYLCKGPKADGIWFAKFDDQNVSTAALYDPTLPVHVSIDSGVFTGAVWFQVRRDDRFGHKVTVFADCLVENVGAEDIARRIVSQTLSQCGSAIVHYSTDPAGGSRNPVGPTVIAEYERVGLKPLLRWPHGPVADSLSFLEGLACSADGTRSLLVHPNCKHLIAAMKSYRRAKRGGQWMDYPEDPQHPAEDLVDALRGGLKVEFPEGNKSKPIYPRREVGFITH